ncbi:MAG: hypothetical protein R3F54_23805 [Alphaproteobacteria bacterium]
MTAADGRKSPAVRAGHLAAIALFAIALATGWLAFDFGLKMRIAQRDTLFAVHRLAGLGCGVLLLLWLGYRLRHLRRLLALPGREALIAAYHMLLATICLILPTLPWIGRALGGRSAELYTLRPIANLVSHPALPATYKLLHWHRLLVDVALVMLLAHMLGALFHLLVMKDDTVRRMLALRGD